MLLLTNMSDEMPPVSEAPQQPTKAVLVLASIDKVSDVRALIQEASEFKQRQGDDLWGDEPFTDEEVATMIDGGNLFVYEIQGVMAATILLAKSDGRMWGEDEGTDESAIYAHRLCTSDAFRGQGLGGKVMSLAEEFALKNGKTRLRLDCSYDNRRLCEYYESLGFAEVRRYDRPRSLGGRNPDTDVYRAALYQKELI